MGEAICLEVRDSSVKAPRSLLRRCRGCQLASSEILKLNFSSLKRATEPLVVTCHGGDTRLSGT